MNDQANPEFVIGQMRILTLPELTYFYATNQPTEFGNLDRDLDLLLTDLYEARKQVNSSDVSGPDITRYYPTGTDNLFRMEVGVPVKAGTLPVGKALVKTLPSYHCAALLLWGSLAHIFQAYETLSKEIQAAGLERTGECQEWNYWFESSESPNNLIGLYMGVK